MNLPKQKIAALRKRVSLLAGFPDDHINTILQFARRRNLRDGELIISEGTLSTKVYIIISGAAKVSRRVESSEEEIATLNVGATLGEMGIIDSAPRSARVVAKGATSILEIEMEGFHNLPAEATSILFRNLCKVLVKRVRGANTRIKDLAGSAPEHIDLEALVLESGLVGAELASLRASGVAAVNSEFRAAILSESDFSAADFSNANLTGADFESANLTAANFEKADLSGTVFLGANLAGADFRGADLSQAIFDAEEEGELGAIGEGEDGSIDESSAGMMRALLPKPDEE